MKNSLNMLNKIGLLGIGILLWSCGMNAPEGTIKLSGEILNPIGGGLVKVERIFNDQLTVVDSFFMETKNTFERQIQVDEPAFYRLNLFGRQYVNLILNDTDVKVVADGNKPNGTFTVEGSPDTDHVVAINKSAQEFQQSVQMLNSEFLQARNSGDNGKVFALQQQYLQMKQQHDQNLKDQLWNMGNSIAVIIAMYQFINPEEEFTFYDSIASKFSRELPTSAYTQDLVAKVSNLRKLAVGSMAPDINLPNPQGQLVSLSSFKGKYVMIDFWAAWCRPCRMENPNVVRMYNKYHDKGFEILGVSLDRKKDAWIKAISDDGLTWNQVSDLKYFNSAAAKTYNIMSIPATYLIGPDGKIVAKGLRGPSLEAKLEEIFG